MRNNNRNPSISRELQKFWENTKSEYKKLRAIDNKYGSDASTRQLKQALSSEEFKQYRKENISQQKLRKEVEIYKKCKKAKNYLDAHHKQYKNILHRFTQDDDYFKILLKKAKGYDIVGYSSEGRTRVRRNNKEGFVDLEGNEVIPLQYDSVSPFSEGHARVRKNGKYGFIDKNGKEITPLKYDSIRDFSEGRALVRKNGKYGFIDRDGNEVISLQYNGAKSFSEGCALVRKNGGRGFVDLEGNEVILLQYNQAESFSEGRALVKEYSEKYHIDRNGNRIS